MWYHLILVKAGNITEDVLLPSGLELQNISFVAVLNRKFNVMSCDWSGMNQIFMISCPVRTAQKMAHRASVST